MKTVHPLDVIGEKRPVFCPPFTPMCDILSPVRGDKFEIKHFELTKKDVDLNQLNGIFSGGTSVQWRWTEPGKYVRLTRQGKMYGPLMSDTGMERYTNLEVVREARGNVLIAGLGLGMILVPILAKPEVNAVTVIEIEPEVIELVVPQLQPVFTDEEWAKLLVINADILEWRPPARTKFDTIYFDIWPTVCDDNLEEMEKLHRSYGQRKNPGAWIGSWRRDRYGVW